MPPTTPLNGLTGGPLPWLPGIPDHIAADPNWGPYLDARSRLVVELADQVRSNAEGDGPAWAALRRALGPAELIADVQVWRAAPRSTPATCDPPGHPRTTTPPEFSNNDLTSDSPLRMSVQTCDGGNFSPEKPLARPQIRSCPSWQKD